MIAKREIQFVDNYHVPALTESRAQSSKIPNLVYLGWALQQMADCDDVIFSDNWETARGCQVEKLAYDLYFSLNKHTSK